MTHEEANAAKAALADFEAALAAFNAAAVDAWPTVRAAKAAKANYPVYAGFLCAYETANRAAVAAAKAKAKVEADLVK